MEERVKHLEEEQRKMAKSLEDIRRQQTEPIKVTIERRQTEVERTLEKHTAMLQELSTEQKSQTELLQILFNQSGTQSTDIGMLKHKMEGVQADISNIKATQSDHGELLKQILARLPEPPRP